MTFRLTLWLGLVTMLAVGVPPAAGFPGENGRIVFSSNRVVPSELYSMNEDGTDLRRLTWNATQDQFPRVSPDGSRIVFARTVAGNDLDIWIMNADGTGERQLTSGPARDDQPAFTKDGDAVVFQRVPAAGGNPCPCEIRIVGADGTGERRVDTGTGDAANPDVSKNGKLAFVAAHDGTRSIYVTDLRGGPVKRVTVGPALDFGDYRPRWSPRGNDLVFMRNELGPLSSIDVWTVHQDGSDLRRLTTTARLEDFPHWSPDGTRIVFAALDTVQPFGGRLHTIAADGSDERVLPQLAAPFVDRFDDGRIDGSTWYQIFSGSGVSITETGGRLVADFATGAVPGGPFNQIATHTGMQCRLGGDFELQVDYTLLDWPAVNGIQAFLSGFTDFSSAQILRESKPWGEQYGSWIDPSFVSVPTGDTAGRFRLVRAGGFVTASYLGGGGWIELNAGLRPETMVAAVGAGDFQTFSGLHVAVAFDDFTLSSGELTCPASWRDTNPDWSVR